LRRKRERGVLHCNKAEEDPARKRCSLSFGGGKKQPKNIHHYPNLNPARQRKRGVEIRVLTSSQCAVRQTLNPPKKKKKKRKNTHRTPPQKRTHRKTSPKSQIEKKKHGPKEKRYWLKKKRERRI